MDSYPVYIYPSIVVNRSMYVFGDHIFEYALKVSSIDIMISGILKHECICL